MKKSIVSILLLFWLSSIVVFSQTIEEPEEEIPYVEETFKTYRLVNSHSVETVWAKDLMFTITHRFGGRIKDGGENLFGIDGFGNIRLELVYGITDNLNLGIGRSRLPSDKLYDGFLKYRLLRQVEGGLPISLTLLGSAAVNFNKWDEDEKAALSFQHRMSYTGQILLASKLNNLLSVQLMPTIVHRNLAGETTESNTTYAIGGAARFRINEGKAIVIEYHQILNKDELKEETQQNILGLGFDITSDRHSFQIQITNNTAPVLQESIPKTFGDVLDGQLHIGFTITRKFFL